MLVRADVSLGCGDERPDSYGLLVLVAQPEYPIFTGKRRSRSQSEGAEVKAKCQSWFWFKYQASMTDKTALILLSVNRLVLFRVLGKM
jgi:hypothetical protein